MVSGLYLLRRLLLHGAGNPELGPLVVVFEVKGDGAVGGQGLCVGVQQLGIQQ